ncbi:MAG: D-alanine--D-alanine ligase [Deltaproteobacteria bacterium]|nr:D-alanine--D-alanine ligase [Deltaproteobacteria bacterium]
MAVVLGGMSAEREISQMTGESVARVLSERGYNASVIRMGRDLPARLLAARIDVVFNALHGRYGEDGCVQGLLEVMGIAYTGSGVLASAIGMNKIASKRVWQTFGLPTPEWRGVAAGETIGASFVLPAKLPLVVKPAAEGSSVGVSIVRERSKLPSTITKARAFGGEVLLERYVEGREVTVGILGTRALCAMEVVPEGEFHSFEVKYTPGKERFVLPAPLSKKAYDRVLELALEAHRATGAESYSRVDLRVDAHEAPFLIEINTLPGLTHLSYLPKMAAHVGITYSDLVETILDGASLKMKEAQSP